ncbi:MAG: ATP-binding cassette domain-containing protein [Solirubrobacteraceae bacterium]
MAAVRAIGLVKRFGATCALDAVDLVVEEGEVRGLLGPNGAGKTTLLRVLFGLVRPDAGELELFGQAVATAGQVPLDGVAGFVEDPSFYPYLSGRTNLELLAELDGGRTRARIDEVLERVGLARRGQDRVGGYSTGMRQRLGIAAALLREPRLLLLDEPTSGLDPQGTRDVGALVQELAGAGIAILLSSHQIGEIEGVCDNYTVLRRGRVVWSGTAAQSRAQAPASAYALSTSDDARAFELADEHAGVHAMWSRTGQLALTVSEGSLDAYVLALGRAGIAVRLLELLVSPLESMFFALTQDAQDAPTALHELAESALTRR